MSIKLIYLHNRIALPTKTARDESQGYETAPAQTGFPKTPFHGVQLTSTAIHDSVGKLADRKEKGQ
jgi:hypothetical protein